MNENADLLIKLYQKLDNIQIKAQNLCATLEKIILLYTNCERTKSSVSGGGGDNRHHHHHLSNKKNHEHHLGEKEKEIVKLLVTYQLICLKICHNSSKSLVRIAVVFQTLIKNERFLEENFETVIQIIRIFENKCNEIKSNEIKSNAIK
jgi:hypothetical protein